VTLTDAAMMKMLNTNMTGLNISYAVQILDEEYRRKTSMEPTRRIEERLIP